MQHNKITDNVGEFQKFIECDSKTGMCLEDTIRFFDIQRIFGQFGSVKLLTPAINITTKQGKMLY